MFCPNCGKGDQEANAFCRQCGELLPDLDSGPGKKPISLTKRFELLNVHFTISTVVAFGFGAFLFYLFFTGKTNEIAIASALVFFIIGLWQIIGMINTRQLKKRFERDEETEIPDSVNKSLDSKETADLLPEADFEDLVPNSVTESTTKRLKQKVRSNKKSDE